MPIFWEIVDGIIANFSQNVREIIANYRNIFALIFLLETADFYEIVAKLSPERLI